jgi:origin recognition complex subunit 5
LQAHLPSPSVLNVHGLAATGKSSILRSYFHLSNIPYTIINVRECITARHLLEQMVASSLDALDDYYDETNDRRPYARTENLSALCVNLSKLLTERRKFVLILDAVDKLRESGGALIAALGRLGESVREYNIIKPYNTHCLHSQRYPISPSFSRRPYPYHL